MDKTLQEERMRGYFLTAVKDLIRAEGIAVVTARNVAERAGYSYATLYNYFKDIRDLIFSCIEDFMEECRDFINHDISNVLNGISKIKQISRSYIKFMIQYPGIFDLFYEQNASDISTSKSNFQSIYNFFDSLIGNEWEEALKNKNYKKEKIKAVGENYKLALHGLLLFYLNRRIYMDFDQLIEKNEDIINQLIK